jgi:hypothetical protein
MVEIAKTEVERFRIQTIISFISMNEVLQAVLTDPSARTADAAEALAAPQADFLSWT